MAKQNKLIGAFWIVFGVVVFVSAVVVLVSFGQKTTIQLGSGQFKADLALTEKSREQGLSGVKKLDSDQVLLMAFPGNGNWGIWMKQMNFPIDIVWLNSNKTVVYIVANAKPDSYPTVFMPPVPTRYVIEFPAGTVNDKAITVGESAKFQINMGDIK